MYCAPLKEFSTVRVQNRVQGSNSGSDLCSGHAAEYRALLLYLDCICAASFYSFRTPQTGSNIVCRDHVFCHFCVTFASREYHKMGRVIGIHDVMRGHEAKHGLHFVNRTPHCLAHALALPSRS